MAKPKVRLPLDLSPEESDAITNAAKAWNKTKKGLVIDALKAYGVNFDKPSEQSPYPPKDRK